MLDIHDPHFLIRQGVVAAALRFLPFPPIGPLLHRSLRSLIGPEDGKFGSSPRIKRRPSRKAPGTRIPEMIPLRTGATNATRPILR